MKPAITLHAPRRMGKDWVLEAEIAIGHDRIRIAAFISPESAAWVKSQLQKGGGWIGKLIQKAQAKISSHVGLVGEWGGKFGPLGELATSVAYQYAASPELNQGADMAEATSLYLALTGEQGPRAQAMAEKYAMAIIHDAAEGIEQAIEAETTLKAIELADSILHHPAAYDHLVQLEQEAQSSADAQLVLCAVRSLGASTVSEPVVVSYDVESYLGEPERAQDMFGYIRNAGLMRGLAKTKKAARMSDIELVSSLSAVLRSQGIRPGVAVGMEKCCIDEMPSFDAVAGMPYYSAGHNIDNQFLGSKPGSGFVDPDTEMNMRGPEWGAGY